MRDMQADITSAWIGSVQVCGTDMSSGGIRYTDNPKYALVLKPGLVFGRLFDMGYLRLPVAAASGLLILCTFLTAQCTEFWHFLLCQGFGIGVRPSYSCSGSGS